MATSRSSRRKQQSRLTFTPLPSSSPATKGYHRQIQERAAAVGYEGSPNPAKRRKLRAADNGTDNDLGAAQLDGVNDDLPTPAATMERGGDIASDDEHEDDSEPIRSTQRRSSANDSTLTLRKRSRQQPLDFSNVRSSDSFSSPVILSSSARPQSSAKAGMFGTQTRRKTRRQPATVNISSDESEGSDALPSPEKTMAKSRAEKSKRVEQSRKRSEKEIRTTRASQRPIIVESDDEEEDEDDAIVVSGGPRHEADQEEEEEEEDEEEMPTTAGRVPRQRRRERSRDSFISSSPPRAIDSDDDIEIIEEPKKRRSCRDEDEDEDDDVPVTPNRRKLKPSRRLTQQEKDDLADDLDDFGAKSDVEALNATPKTTQSKQKSARQSALEQLKRKRSGRSDPIEIPDEDEGQEDAGNDFDELYDDDDEVVAPQPTSSRQMFKADEYDDDFIEEEEGDGVLGIPEGMPIEYTIYARQKAKDLFKHAIEWMVQKKINPAFQRTDEVYDLAFRKLDDEVQGLAGSKFTSAAWTPQFTMALKARPDIAFEAIDRDTGEHWLRDKCDACNRSGHPATYQIQFQGTPYHPHTLEEVGGRDEHENDEDDEDASSSGSDNDQDNDADDRPAYDHQGRVIAPANTIYYVGKFCMANAETAHSLSHWRYHLNEWVIQWLDRSGYNTAEKIVQRDGWSTKKRRKYANKVADRMEQEGVVRDLWREFRKNIDEARSSKQGRFTAGDD
ncbi:hypothetical protein LTR36_008414 [Oleoguttula mirabilis]|uniref:DUF4211 domain-containing protein n=1 Tax=Oleoguttula mirabilis TaxID=1507867 RepID=A0AAV9J7Z4_9PEZI|nr:hypothetical protein LTR36_008414 [Oleoguttula mirabilis]